jgi:hypothetical protein
MNGTHPLAMKLIDLPLWRLLVALDDAERVSGSGSPSARALALAVRERLRAARRDGGADAKQAEVIRA